MSHVKNVQAFGKLMGICTGYGGQYKPGQQHLQVNAMITLLNSAQLAMEDVNEAQNFYDQATNLRELGFNDLRKVSAAVYHMLKSSGSNALTVNDARMSHRKIYGARKTKPKPVGEAVASEENPKSLASYGQDYATLVHHFASLLETVSAEPLYNPSEETLSIAGLQQKLVELRGLNSAVINAEILLATARRNRNELYYASAVSLIATAQAAKQYVRGVFGYQSAQHQEVKRLQFTNPIS